MDALKYKTNAFFGRWLQFATAAYGNAVGINQ